MNQKGASGQMWHIHCLKIEKIPTKIGKIGFDLNSDSTALVERNEIQAYWQSPVEHHSNY